MNYTLTVDNSEQWTLYPEGTEIPEDEHVITFIEGKVLAAKPDDYTLDVYEPKVGQTFSDNRGNPCIVTA